MRDHDLTDPYDIDAERLIEERIDELRAIALRSHQAGEPADAPEHDEDARTPMLGHAVPSRHDAPAEASLRHEPRRAVTPAAFDQSRHARRGRFERPARRSQDELMPPPVRHARSEAPPRQAPAMRPTLEPMPRATVQRTEGAVAHPVSAAQLSASLARVQHEVQEDIARIEQALRAWGSPAAMRTQLASELTAELQRLEHALRSDLARLGEAVHETQVTHDDAAIAESLSAWATRLDRSVTQHADAIRRDLREVAETTRSSSDDAARAAAAAAAIAGSTIGDKLLGSLDETARRLQRSMDGLDSTVSSLHQNVEHELQSLHATIMPQLQRSIDDMSSTLAQQLESTRHQQAADIDAALDRMARRMYVSQQQLMQATAAGIASDIAATRQQVDESGHATRIGFESFAREVGDRVGQAFGRIEARVEHDAARMEDDFSALRETLASRLDAIDEREAAAEAALDTMGAGIEELRAAVTSTTARIDELGGQADAAAERLGTRLDGATTALSAQIERSSEATQTRLKLAAGSIDEHAGRITGELQALRDELLGQVTDVREAIGHVEDRVSAAQAASEQLADMPSQVRHQVDQHGELFQKQVHDELAHVQETLLTSHQEATEGVTSRVLGALDELRTATADDAAAHREASEQAARSTAEAITALREELRADATTAHDRSREHVDRIADDVLSQVRELTEGAREQLSAAIVEVRAEVRGNASRADARSREQLEQLQTRLVNELDYNRLQHVRDIELVIDALTSGWSSMAQQLEQTSARLEALEQRVEGWIDSIDEES